MLFRYRARNYPATLSSDEQALWREFCRERFSVADGSSLTMEAYMQRIKELKAQPEISTRELDILDELDAYGRSVQASLA